MFVVTVSFTSLTKTIAILTRYHLPVREKWDPKKPEFEAEILEILGEPWTIDIDPHKIWPYAEEDSWAKRYTGELMRE